MYLITTKIQDPSLTPWFDMSEHFNPDPEIGMIVYDLGNLTYTKDGKKWELIEGDHL